MARWFALSLLVAALPVAAAAQNPPTDTLQAPLATLTLTEALEQARINAPDYLQVANNAGPARWGVRNAYGSFLPTVTVSGGVGYTGSGQSNFGGGFTFQTSPIVSSSYGLDLNWQLNGSVLTAPGQQKANQRAVIEDIANAGSLLKFNITNQYLTSLQASAQVTVAQQQVQRQEDFLKLAQAKYQVGQSTLIDVRQAEVQKGQAEIALLRAVQADNEAKLELFRRIGVVPPVTVGRVALTDSFAVTQPSFDLQQLLTLAEDQNPELRALKAREDAARWNTRAAKSRFLPSISVSAGWSGFTQRQTDESVLLANAQAGALGGARDCFYQDSLRSALGFPGVVGTCYAANGLDPATLQLDAATRSAVLASNDIGLFDFTGQPFSIRLGVTLPIFTGFGRSLQVSQARAQQEDVSEQVRARGLQVRAEVEARYLGLQTSFRAIAVQQANREAARDQLRLAQDRYRLGSGTSLELSDAQNALTRAEGDYVNAVYDYHKAVAALEAAIGRPLR
ncbi:MAG: TolC family protein [Gemmatimonadales bacterium]